MWFQDAHSHSNELIQAIAHELTLRDIIQSSKCSLKDLIDKSSHPLFLEWLSQCHLIFAGNFNSFLLLFSLYRQRLLLKSELNFKILSKFCEISSKELRCFRIQLNKFQEKNEPQASNYHFHSQRMKYTSSFSSQIF